MGPAATLISPRPAETATAAAAVPAVSVLMAVRNGERFIDEAIASVLGQTLADLELVVVDNGSRDGTPARIADWCRRDLRVRAFRLDRPGLSRALNYAAAQARAPVLARLDADDIAERTRLEVQLAALAGNPKLGVIGSHALLIDARGRHLGEVRRPIGSNAIRAYLANGNPFVHSSVIMRRALFEQLGGYREGLLVAEDFDLWMRFAEITEIDVLPEMLVRYRVHGNSMMQRHAARAEVAAACVRAAAEARRGGASEPFSAGRPQLRSALPLLDLDRAAFRHAMRVRLLRQRIDTWYQCLPVSARFKTWVRSLAIRIGLKPLFGWSLNRVARQPSRTRSS